MKKQAYTKIAMIILLVQSWAGDAALELQTIHAERALKHESVSLKPRAEMVSLKFKTRDREPTESSQQ